MQEQGKTAAWCGRLLLFTARFDGLATLQTPGHPVTGNGGNGGHGGHGGHRGCRETGRRPAARTGLPRGRWAISGPPRPTLPA
ncbi:hypothetical protein ABR737_14195 [Streptomyces sp. Edi2]|uniref:hypothetical protein n=1 Tax=Streptomyces sp. Edi2 TaxID=3162528 RepID=UPI003305A04A